MQDVKKFRMINMRHQKIEGKYFGELELKETHLIYKHDFECEQPIDKDDLTQGWEKVRVIFERTMLRERISNIDFEFDQTSEKHKDMDADKWNVVISAYGVQYDLSIHYRKEEEARKMYDELIKWWLC